MKTYAEKLKDPRWQKKRLEIMRRDEFACTMCGDSESELQVHHKEYHSNAQPWDYSDEDLCTLCRECHVKVKRLKERIGRLISEPYGYQMFENLAIFSMCADIPIMDKMRVMLEDFGLDLSLFENCSRDYTSWCKSDFELVKGLGHQPQTAVVHT